MSFAAQLEEAVAEAKVMARRKTADGIHVLLWSDGSITSSMGFKLKGVPMVKNARVGWRFMGEVSLYDADELHALYKAAQWADKRNGNPGDVRARASKLLEPKPLKLKPVWTVLSADRDGKPTERYWKLNRIQWPGLVVWDHINKLSRGGRYEVASVDRSGVVDPGSGVTFRNMAEVSKYLATIKVRR